VPTITHSRLRWSSRAAVLAALCVALVLPATATSMPTREHVPAAQVGEPNPGPRGDTPFEFPGMSGARDYQPAPIEIVRPMRTVRESNPAWRMLLPAAALLVALVGTGYTVIRTRSLERRLPAYTR
jgi:hypothetical protein